MLNKVFQRTSRTLVEAEAMDTILSKVGDDVVYSFTVTNTGDVALFLESAIDDVIGDITTNAQEANCDEVAAGEDCTFEVTYTIGEEDDDPLINEVLFVYNTQENLEGHEVSAGDTHETNLFQPSIVVTKDGPDEGAVGETVTYEFRIENTSSDDAPNLILDSVSDDVLGDLKDEAALGGCEELASGEECQFSADHILEAEPNPLVNTVTVTYNPEGFPNEIIGTDTHSLDVIVEDFAGCTPGFWRQEHHFGHWMTYSPDDDFNEVFGTDAELSVGQGRNAELTDEFSLEEAVRANGGGFNALARHSVAALLNAANYDVNYAYSEAEVISKVQGAVNDGNYEEIKDILEEANEFGCSLDGQAF